MRRKCELKGRACEISLGRRGGSSYGEGERGIRSCCPKTSQFIRPPGIRLQLEPLHERARVMIIRDVGREDKKGIRSKSN